MPNVLTLTVEVPDQILNTGAFGAGALMRLQTATTRLGTYADVTGTGSTPTTVVVTGVRAYTAYDPNGTTSSWYRTRFENVAATRLSVDWVGDALWYQRDGHAPFQVGGEAAGLICSLYDVKQALGLGTSTTSDEEILEHIRHVTDAIQHYTGRRFCRTPSSGTTTFLFDVRSTTRTLWVPKGIAEMSQLEVATQTGGAFTVVPTADWFLDPPETERSHGWPATRVTISDIPTGSVSSFYPGMRVVRTTMAEGWAAVPGDVEGIGTRAVVASFMSKDSPAGGAVAVGPSGGTMILRHISPADRASLDAYRSIPI